jgi:outer membrane receptor protein involved in Fe transport
MYYRNRIENVPEFRLNFFNKYTFTDTLVRGLSLGLGARYSSTTIISRSLDYNPDRGGLTAGNYLIFDANISYPWSLRGYKLNSSLGIQNLTDKTYYEGNLAPADHRFWLLRTDFSF